MEILHIDSSVVGAHSASRALSADLLARQRVLQPDHKITRRDLETDSVVHLSPSHLVRGGAVTDQALGEDLAKGGLSLEELFAAVISIIGAPMYNFSIQTTLRAWIDRVCVAGETFRYGANGPEGLLTDKKLFIASSRGNVYALGSPIATFGNHESRLKGKLSFIGVNDVSVVRAEGRAFGDEARDAVMSKARTHIAELAA